MIATRKRPRTTSPAEAWRDFERVAPNYGQGNLLLDIELELGTALLPQPRGACVLDAGCGHGRWGRWAREQGARRVVQIDRAWAMSRRAAADESMVYTLQADFHSLPVAAASIDLIVASLCLEYTETLDAAVLEMARCLRPGGALYLSNLHPDSGALGWRRTYDLPDGKTVEPACRIHRGSDYLRSLKAGGLVVTHWRELRLDASVQRHFDRAREMPRYRRWLGAPLLLAVVATKAAPGKPGETHD